MRVGLVATVAWVNDPVPFLFKSDAKRPRPLFDGSEAGFRAWIAELLQILELEYASDHAATGATGSCA